MPRKILVLGNIWHGNFSRFLTENLRKLGHEAEQMHMSYAGSTRYPWQKLQKKLFVRKLNADIRKYVADHSVDLVIATTPFHVTRETWDFIYSRGIETSAWFGDNPLWKQGMIEGIERYTSVFFPDEEWAHPAAFLNRASAYLPHAADPDIFYPIESLRGKQTIDILFVAHAYPGTGDGLLRASIAHALVEAGLNVTICGGKDWDMYLKQFPALRSCMHAPVTSPDRLNELYNSSKIVLNVHHTQLFTGTNQRTPEVAAAGAFLLSDFKQSIVDFYGDDQATFRSIPEAIEKVRYFLSHDAERQAYAEKSRARILDKHTYKHRARTILESLKK